ncbi:XRE family transcriptional regulator [Nonomuraea rhodomycinica]|uniref:XRE family transcriptional regulator n=1 Tax=Nonomuraea rhodomycinica TaxID=1712872 RepID=A0A7Y6J0A1_9ACTN|nr:XRE family transcriptional regulator [Nonomuraea rhodomycinica]NUW46314.1 XRE family transcriptional regulator [Nonomuraea rhodomycinica]
MRESLKNRDIAGLFRLVAKYGGISQVRIASATEIAQPRVNKIFKGTAGPIEELAVFERIATGLGLPDHARMLLGLAPLDIASPTGDLDDEHQEQTDELAARLEAAAAVDDTMVMILRTDTNNLRLQDRRLGSVAIADKMRAQMAQIERAHRHAIRPRIRAQLAHLLAETASLAGWQAINTVALNDAWNHYEAAKAAAREAEDAAVLAYVSGEQAYVLMDMGRPAEAAELLQHIHAVHRDHVPARLRTWLAAAEGEAAAILGDETACRRALDQAAAVMPEGDGDPDMPYLSINVHHFARWRGSCLLRFGDPGTVEDLRSSLAGMDGTYNRAEAGVRCDLGHALLAAGEPEAAQPHIHRAKQLATMTGSRRQRRRIDELTRAVNRALGR